MNCRLLINFKRLMSGHINEEDVFGSTAEAHQALMALIWGPGINISIFLSMYSFRKLWGYVHGVYGIFACIYTLATSLPILFFAGIIDSSSSLNYGHYSATTLNNHFLVGLAAMFAISGETLLGIITKIMYFLQAKSTDIIKLKKLHTLFGYAIIVLCKLNYFIIQRGDGGFWVLLMQDIIFAVLLLIWKISFPKMEAKILNMPDNMTGLKTIQSISQLQAASYTVFANYVYRIEQLQYYHPGGYQVVESVKNREVDRYIYGMLPTDDFPDIEIHSHSYKSFTLLGSPIAKISIPSTYSGFTTDQVVVRISSLRKVSEKGCIYQMRLVREKGKFTYERYTNVAQLGRYYSISLNNQVTRLYTSANFLAKDNKIFMGKHLQGYDDQYGKNILLGKEVANVQLMEHLVENYVPFLFKQYNGGKFTDSLIKRPIRSLILSPPKGEGLRMSQLQPGKIIMVAGGTGIYPFSDLIDLLFKQELMIQKQNISEEVIELSPILRDHPFDGFTFHVMAAFDNFDDIHPITLCQMVYLSQRKKVEVTLKVKHIYHQKLKSLKSVRLIEHGFEEELKSQLKKSQISKIWICGPPKMNRSVSQYLKGILGKRQIYLIL